MQTISLKLPDHLLEHLEREAKARRVTKSLLVRESLITRSDRERSPAQSLFLTWRETLPAP